MVENVLAFILKCLPFLKYLKVLASAARGFRKKQEIIHEVTETETVDITVGNPTRYTLSRQRTERTFRKES